MGDRDHLRQCRLALVGSSGGHLAQLLAFEPFWGDHDRFWVTFEALLASAEVVISHAGPGTLAAIRLAGKVPIVVPRARAHREHVDDHQERYAARLRSLPGYVVVQDLRDLTMALTEARRIGLAAALPDVAHAVQALREAVGCEQ